jgi:hypothetical protein
MSIPTPLMIEPAGELSSQEASSVRPAAGAEPPPTPRREDETIATRPLETPVQPIRPKGESARSYTMRNVIVGSVGAIAVLSGVLAWKAASLGPVNPVGPAKTSDSVVQAPTVTTPTAPPSAPTAAISIAAPVSAPPPTREPSVSLTVPSASAEKVGRATASLVGDPGTRVSVDGVSRGACPMSISLEPGQHEFRFMFDATGESRGERVGVKAGDKLTVRASFTGATPTIRIQRQ